MIVMRHAMLGILSIIFPLMGLLSCSGPQQQKETANPVDFQEPLMEANRHAVKTESQHIEDFLRRYQWDMTETGSGLRYMIYKEGEGPKALKGMTATLTYTLKLITGDVVYSSEELGPLQFQVGKGEVISGLEEAILLLKLGDEAKIIIPSHLAYGLVGDGDRIPGKATLIYDLKLLKLNN